MTELNKKVVTRFAPSPTGFMHVGGVRTALFAYLWAQKNGGKFILRIEDTDKEREVEGAIAHIMESLRWLGLEWDYGPDKENPFGSAIQSERLPTYIEAAKKLIAKGFAYPDPYTQEEVEGFRKKAATEKRPFLFRDHRPETFIAWDEKRPLRFCVPNVRRMHWNDIVRGELEAGEEALDDFVLIKSDGYPTYNLAHIIDDMHMEVTHIMRADEFISSMPKFLSLYEALEIVPPAFVTLPPIMREDRTKKLGKRDGAKDILEYRDDGYLPDAMTNFLALTGWNPGTAEELFTPEELIAKFDVTGIQKAGALLNEDKLAWVNKKHIKRMDEKTRLDMIESFITSEMKESPNYSRAMLEKISPIIIERITHFGEVRTMCEEGELSYFFTAPKYPMEKLLWKGEGDVTSTKARLLHIQELLKALPEGPEFTPESVKNALWSYAEAEGRGTVLWPLRYALSGRDKSPDPFLLSGILGKAEVLARLDSAVR